MSDMSMSQKPISSLAKEVMNKPAHHQASKHGCYNDWWFYLFWFLIVAVIAWFLLFALKPDFVQKDDDNENPTGEVDQGKVLLWAVIIGLVAVFLIWIFQWGSQYSQ
jgi:heme/copper-type cytochrome/quinol oxidase subunit 2